MRTDDSWREWNFPKLVDKLRKWTERNPIQCKQSDKPGVIRIFKVTSPGVTRIFKVTSPGVIRIFKLSSREMAEIGDAFIVKIKITHQLTAKWLPLSKTERECLATNASVSIAPEPNTEPTIARALPCARFVTESITPPSVTASIIS